MTSSGSVEHASAKYAGPKHSYVASTYVPKSVCDASCTSRPQRKISVIRLAFKTLRLIGGLGLVILVVPLLLGTAKIFCTREKFTKIRNTLARLASRVSLWSLGMKFSVIDQRIQKTTQPILIVANHISFIDALAIAAVFPANFVAKAEAVELSVLGFLVKKLGIISLRRERLRELPSAVATVTDRLNQQKNVAVFPEGTTWCGVSHGRLRPAFFQAAIDAEVPIQPITVSYFESSSGGSSARAIKKSTVFHKTTVFQKTTAPSYIGDDSIGDTLKRVLKTSNPQVNLILHERQLPAPDRVGSEYFSRSELARVVSHQLFSAR